MVRTVDSKPRSGNLVIQHLISFLYVCMVNTIYLLSTDEDPSLRVESSAIIINLRGVSTKLNNIIQHLPAIEKVLRHGQRCRQRAIHYHLVLLSSVFGLKQKRTHQVSDSDTVDVKKKYICTAWTSERLTHELRVSVSSPGLHIENIIGISDKQ